MVKAVLWETLISQTDSKSLFWNSCGACEAAGEEHDGGGVEEGDG